MRCTECGREVEGHRWSKIRANEEGWFQQKDGTAYCPEHVPAWVSTWRDKR